MKRAAMALSAVALVATARADEHGDGVVIAAPSRPFLLLDARRRYRPQEHARAFLQRRGGGEARLAVFRVHDPRAFVEASVSRQGVSTAAGPWGDDAESLLRGAGPLPRRGAALTLVSARAVRLAEPPPPRRAVGDESAAYDSNEDDEGSVETWGVSARGWGVAEVDLGALPAGTYLLRAHSGMFATSALLSVGDAVVLLRRGDSRDLVRVTDGEGAGLAGVAVETDGASGVTDARGELTLPASDRSTRRVYARRGEDLAWAEALHTRLPQCDARVYLAAGRPVYRPGEEVKVRGHVRACGPVAGARVRVFPTSAGPEGETVTADADGNFSATLVARADIGAEHLGRVHARTLSLDARPVPSGSLRVRFDRAWAAAGERVTVTASPEGDGDVQTVQFRWQGGEVSEAVSQGGTASASVVIPASLSALETFTVSATARGGAEVLTARASLWTGRHREVLALTSTDERGVAGAEATLSLRARDLGGDPSPGPVQLAVHGSDGNRPVGDARWRGEVIVPASGALDARVRLAGAGPWWVRATRGEVTGEAVLWERARPPTLGATGPLALRPERAYVSPGERLAVALRAAGPAWVTLEQGGVWSSQLVQTSGGVGELSVTAPPEARGLATLVATRVHEGRVETATAVAEVATSRRFSLSLEAERNSMPPGSEARVIVRARTTDGRPRGAVLSLWLEDAGWWSLGEERHPGVDEYFRATGRPASAGDSTRPLGFGSEEGRRTDSGMFWNGERVPGTTFRHAWGHGGEVISLRAQGDLTAIADALARAAGLRGASMCAARVRPAGTVTLEVRELPWDLAAARLAERSDTWARREGDALRFACAAPLERGGYGGYGSGHGGGGGSLRSSGPMIRDRDLLSGTQWFLAARRIPDSGSLDVRVPLPPGPGRWRLHALAIADDGAGAQQDADINTVQPVTASLSMGRAIMVGDALEAVVRVHRTEVAPEGLGLALRGEGGVTVEGGGEAPLTFDARGDARRTFRVRGTQQGQARLTAEVTHAGRVVDGVRAAVAVRDDHGEEPVRYEAVVHAEPTDVDLPIAPLAAPAELTVEVDRTLAAAVSRALESLRAPRWHIGALALDRLASLRALEVAAARLRGDEARRSRDALRAELQGAAAALAALRGSDGEVAWWSQVPGDLSLTATALALGAGPEAAWTDAWRRLRTEATRDEGPSAPRVAAALARGSAQDRAAGLALLRRLTPSDLASLSWATRAARDLGDAAQAQRLSRLLRDALERRVARGRGATCAGPAWFLCLAREGDRGEVAFAARTLLDASPAARPAVLRAVRWLSAHPQELSRWSWGTAEAEVLALLALLDGGAPAGPVAVSMGDVVLARGDGRAPLRVTVREGGTLRLSFGRAPGRFARVSVRGTLRVSPPTQGVGTASLTRRFEGEGDHRAMVLEFSLPRDATSLEIHAPVPAGMELAGGAEDPVSQRDPRRGWRELDGPAGDARARVTRLEDGLRVRYARLRAGRHSVRVPMLTVARGEFRAGSAWLRAAEDEVWAVTPETRTTLP